MAERILIAFFSRSGNTRKIANLIHDEVGGTIWEMQPEVPYPDEYSAVVEQAKREIRVGHRPTIQATIGNIESYDTLIVGTPNWWSTIAPPVATFLSQQDLSGKTVAPFSAHGGGGRAQVLSDIAKLCPHSTVLEGFDVYGSGTGDLPVKVSAWLRRIHVAR